MSCRPMRSIVCLMILSMLCALMTGCSKQETAPYAVGDKLTFGHYEQDCDPDDGPEPIEWTVAAVDGSRVLLISEKILDARPYHDDLAPQKTAWDACTLRQWLNGEFLASAFSAEEQASIPEVDVDNAGREKSIGDVGSYMVTQGSPNTRDRVFLPSYQEMIRYMSVRNPEDRAGTCTPYATARFGTNYDVGWWLRGPVSDEDYAMMPFVFMAGQYSMSEGVSTGWKRVNKRCGLRPALWLETNAKKQTAPTVDMPAQAPEDASIPADTAVGDLVRFGHFEQDNVDFDGAEPIEWLVLERDGDRALLMSRYLLHSMPYFDGTGPVQWETCDARAWLNGDFFHTAFNDEERARIEETEVDNSSVQEAENFPGMDAPPTRDRVFLLSYAQIVKYGMGEIEPLYTARSRAIQQSTSVERWTRSSQGNAFTISVMSMVGFELSRGPADHNAYLQPALWVKLGE